MKTDLPASIIVFLVALPLCMGIAIASNAPPATGLITGIIGGLVVALFAGSPLQVSGPAAGLFVLVAEVIAEHGVAAMGVVVLGAGLIQIAAGALKLGNYFRAVSPAVIQGMLSGIGVLILASQFHVMVDDRDAAKPWLEAGYNKGIANLITMPQSLWLGVVPLDGSPHHLAAAVGVATIAVLVAWKWIPLRTLRIVPGAVVAVALAAAVTSLMGWDITHVVVPADLREGVVYPTTQMLSSLDMGGALFSAIEIALVASAETMLCCAAVDQMQSHARTKYNQELLAQGVGNTLCGFLGALPMTGVIVRSSANVEAGGRTRLSAWLHGVWLLVFVVALPWVLNLIPMASLAAVLVFTGWKLINPAAIRKLWRVSPADGFVCVATLVLVVGVDLLSGVIAGIAMTAARLLWTFARLSIDVDDDALRRRTDLRLNGAATFLSLPQLTGVLDEVPADRTLHVHLEDLKYIDHACLEQFVNWEKQHAAGGGRLVIDWDNLTATFRDAGHAHATAHVPPTAKEPPPELTAAETPS